MKKILKTVNFISGSGTTNLAVLKSQSSGGKLNGLVETLAIVSSDPDASGVQKAVDFGFPLKNIFIVNPKKENLAEQLLKVLDKYKPDYFHQLGWLPFTPKEVIEKYQGLNQHLGPGGRWMYGVRRIYAHIRFCGLVGENRPIPVFCQKVAPQYDAGEIIYIRWEDILPGERTDKTAQRLLKVEHEVQIEGLYRLATGKFKLEPVPKLALNPQEEELLFQARKEARDKIPSMVK